MADRKNIFESFHYREIIIDLGARVLGASDFEWSASESLDGIKQLWLRGFYIRNASAEDIRISTRSGPVSFQGAITNANAASASIDLMSPVAAGGTFQHLTCPVPVLCTGPRTAGDRRLTLKATTFGGVDVSWSRLTLFFLAQYDDDQLPTLKNRNHFMGLRTLDGTY